MAERIHRHFKRLLLPRATSARVRWPLEPAECMPETLDAVYDGDTVHVIARFAEPPTGEAVLEVTLADGRSLTQCAVLSPAPLTEAGEVPSTLARLDRARELKALTDAEAGAALAVCYQLLSPWTGYVVVAERAEGERASDLPALRKVPHMLAVGWGGVGQGPWCARCALFLPSRLCRNIANVQRRLRPSSSLDMSSEPQKRFRSSRLSGGMRTPHSIGGRPYRRQGRPQARRLRPRHPLSRRTPRLPPCWSG